MGIDQGKLDALMGRAVVDLGATLHAAMAVLGDRLGLYKALATQGPMTAQALARATGTHERYVTEWLNSQAAGGYVSYDPAGPAWYLTAEQAFTMADETSPAFLPGGFQVALAAVRAQERAEENFRTGRGMAWGEHHADLFAGTERFFRPGYAAHLVTDWIPALDGVQARLEAGAEVADVGCGHGSSTILMAQSFPRSRFLGLDYHEPSIQVARERARAAGVADRVRFEHGRARDLSGRLDFVTFFDCLHDMEDPLAAAQAVRRHLTPEGRWMIVEPFAGDRPEENHNPVGRTFYGASTLICVPCSLYGGGPALGAQAGEARLRHVVVDQAGFRSLRRATQTPFNLVLEARP